MVYNVHSEATETYVAAALFLMAKVESSRREDLVPGLHNSSHTHST